MVTDQYAVQSADAESRGILLWERKRLGGSFHLAPILVVVDFFGLQHAVNPYIVLCSMQVRVFFYDQPAALVHHVFAISAAKTLAD